LRFLLGRGDVGFPTLKFLGFLLEVVPVNPNSAKRSKTVRIAPVTASSG
jgi:hypothetical protein